MERKTVVKYKDKCTIKRLDDVSPCPFCGHQPFLIYFEDGEGFADYLIQCMTPYCEQLNAGVWLPNIEPEKEEWEKMVKKHEH